MSDVPAALHRFNGSGLLLPDAERARLLQRFPPRYPDAVAHHVTIPEGAKASPEGAEIVGVADDGAGVQALVVRLGGTTDRPDGSTWHVTWSLDRRAGRRPVESNDVIRARGWTPVEPPEPLRLVRR
jgi:hypothetical protein